ncbi:MAG: hypothetical protein K8R21_02175 [Leptospira sp.]|nr:hypothetical protein [Leptospira sp.]
MHKYSLVILLFFLPCIYPGFAGELPLNFDVRSFILQDSKTGKILFKRNEDLVFPVASLTKLVTAITAREILTEKSIVIIPAKMGNNAKGKLVPGEKYYFRDLLVPLLNSSANDASVAIAINAKGTEREFVGAMNRWVSRNGFTRTRFMDSTGHSVKSVSTAREILEIFRLVSRDPIIGKILSEKSGKISDLSGRTIENSYTGAFLESRGVGEGQFGKTGSTNAAKH